MDSDCFHLDPSRHRTKLFQALNGLTSSEFGQLLYGLQPPAGLVPDSEAPQMKRVKALLDWAEGSTGRGTDEIWDALAQLQQGSLASHGQALPNFQPYLQAITTHTQYGKWWEHYTLTDVEGKVKLPKPEQPSVFDFGLMVQTVAKEKDSPAPDHDSRSEHREKIERLPVLEGIRKYADGHVLLVGRPGSGKSTALIRLLMEEASSFTAKPPDALSPSPSPKVGRGGQERIPVLVELRYWQGSIEGLIQGFLKRHGLMLDDAALSAQLGEGRFLLLVDGLNELPTEEARTQLSAFRRSYPHVPMIFTTRDLGLGGDLGIEKKLEMQPLTETQMKAFIRAYVPNQAEAMLRQLNHRLRDFGQTPLLLWMLCEVFQQSPNQQLPNNLAEVFRAFTTMYEDSSVRKHEVALLKGDVRPLSDRRLWKPALMALAALMMQGKTLVDFRVAIHRTEAERELGKIFAKEKFPVRDILDDLLKYHLLQNRTTDQLEFRHQLIQEYYAAEHLLRLLPELSDEQLKRDYLNLLKWTEPIALMLALVNEEAQALRVVKLAIDEVDLVLGARFAGSPNPAFHNKAIGYILQKDTPDWLKVELLGISKTQSAKEILIDYLNHENIKIVVKAATYTGETDNQLAIEKIIYRLEKIDEKFFSQGVYGGSDKTGEMWSLHIETLAHISPERAINFLRNKLLSKEGLVFDPILHYHTEAGEILMRLDSENLLGILIKNLDDLQNKSETQLTQEEHEIWAKKIGFIGIQPEKARSTGFDNCKSILLGLLSQSDNFSLIDAAIISALKKESSASIKLKMIDLLRGEDNDQIDEALIDLICEKSFKIKKKACSILIKRNNIRKTKIERLLGSDDFEISWPAAFVLSRLKQDNAFPVLARVMQSRDLELLEARHSTTQLLGSLDKRLSIPILIDFLKDDSTKHGFELRVRKAAISSLARLGCQEYIVEFLDNFREGYQQERADSMKILADLNLSHELWNIVRNRSLAWETAAVELGKLAKTHRDKKAEVIGFLFDALVAPGHASIDEIIDLLAELIDLNFLYQLIDALKNPEKYTKDVYFPNRVALVLAECPLKEVGSTISDLLKLKIKCDIPQLSWLIPAIQNRCKFYNYEIWQEAMIAQKTTKEPQEPKTSPVSNIFPNAAKVQIFERVEHYYEKPPNSEQ